MTRWSVYDQDPGYTNRSHQADSGFIYLKNYVAYGLFLIYFCICISYVEDGVRVFVVII